MSAKPTKKSSASDWKKVDSIADADVDTSEIPPLDAAFFEKAELRIPQKKKSVTVRIDADVLDWLRSQGKGYQTRINAILRLYMESKRNGAA